MGGSTEELEDAFFGTNQQMIAATDSRTVSSWGPRFVRDPTGFTGGLIQLEIDAAVREHRGDVGPPITVLSITSFGGHFEPELNGACRP
jgi:hypothetical protein